jgi:hypothetical protein
MGAAGSQARDSQPPTRHPAFSQEHNIRTGAQQPNYNASQNYCRPKSNQPARCGCDAYVQYGASWGKA